MLRNTGSLVSALIVYVCFHNLQGSRCSADWQNEAAGAQSRNPGGWWKGEVYKGRKHEGGG